MLTNEIYEELKDVPYTGPLVDIKVLPRSKL